jgi:hypothetical protein
MYVNVYINILYININYGTCILILMTKWLLAIFSNRRQEACLNNSPDDDDVYLYKLQREGVTKSILYTLPCRSAKKALVQKYINDNNSPPLPRYSLALSIRCTRETISATMSSGNGSLLSLVTVIAVANTTSAIANIAPCLLARVGDKHRGRTSLMMNLGREWGYT